MPPKLSNCLTRALVIGRPRKSEALVAAKKSAPQPTAPAKATVAKKAPAKTVATKKTAAKSAASP